MTSTLHDTLTLLTLELTSHEVRLKTLLTAYERIGGSMPAARLDKVWLGLKTLRSGLDQVEQHLTALRSVAEAAIYERDEARRELDALRALAFVNRSTTEGML